MPRRRSRFSNLEQQYRDAGGVAAPGTRLAGYIDYKTGKTKVARRKATSLTPEQRVRYGVSLLPFNIDVPGTVTNASRYQASITSFSLNGANSLTTGTATLLGWGKIDVAGVVAQTNPSYYPALMRPAVATGKAPETPISSITKKEYNYREMNSFSIPFGRTTANPEGSSEEERRKLIATEMKATGTTARAASVGYDPEVWRSETVALAAAPGI